jgi:unsaturated rhamnogalacturonyl hydrolase
MTRAHTLAFTMKNLALFILVILNAVDAAPAHAQKSKEYVAAEAGNPALTKPNYPVPYGPATVAAITEVLNRIHAYLDANTPAQLINKQTGVVVTNFTRPDTNCIIEPGHFPITGYEWGVTYSGMLLAFENTGDAKFKDYVAQRMQFIVSHAPYFQALSRTGWKLENNQFRSVLGPGALDDAGSICAAMIKAQRAGLVEAQPLIDNFADYISTKQYRLADGTLARKRPMQDSLWLDDLYMSVPALAQMGKLTGDRKYYDDAVKQIRQFTQRMFNQQSGLYLHGWIAGMKEHPEFHWARANGWALMAMTELLEVLPADHPGYAAVLEQLRAHARGLQRVQADNGLWHQLLDRNDSYLETSASAIFTYCLARAVNRGWIDPLAYGPTVQLAWNGVATRVNAQGQVEGTCVGTGMGFDPAFYCHRPTSIRAAHGYGPVLLAGAEMIALTKSDRAVINDGAVQFDHQPANMESAR